MGDTAMKAASTEPALFFTAEEFAELLRTHYKTFMEWVSADEKLPRSIRIGKTHLWPRTEVAAWIEAGCPARKVWEEMKSQGAKKGGKKR